MEALGVVTCFNAAGSPDQLLRCLTHAYKLLASLTRINTAPKRAPPPAAPVDAARAVRSEVLCEVIREPTEL